jgi:Glycosyl transferases group 1
MDGVYMRIACLNRRRDVHPGGDLTQIDASIAALAARGIEAVYAPEGWTLDWLRSFDLAHIFHVNFGWSRYNFERVREAGMRYVVTPIFYPSSELGMSYGEIRGVLADPLCRCVMPNSWAERREMRWAGVLHIDTPTEVIPNGTEQRFHGPDVAGDGSDARMGVLGVAARAGDKNVGVVQAMCDELGIPSTIATGIVDRDEMASMYKRARVFVNASESERMSLTIGEALCAGCRVLATRGNRGSEWYGQGLVVIDPGESERLRLRLMAAVKVAYECESWDYSPNRAARSLTWEGVGARLEEVYRKAVA